MKWNMYGVFGMCLLPTPTCPLKGFAFHFFCTNLRTGGHFCASGTDFVADFPIAALGLHWMGCVDF